MCSLPIFLGFWNSSMSIRRTSSLPNLRWQLSQGSFDVSMAPSNICFVPFRRKPTCIGPRCEFSCVSRTIMFPNRDSIKSRCRWSCACDIEPDRWRTWWELALMILVLELEMTGLKWHCSHSACPVRHGSFEFLQAHDAPALFATFESVFRP